MTLSKSQLTQIHTALEQAGSLAGAARHLRMSPQSLKEIIRQCPELSAYLPGVSPPTEAEVLGRSVLPQRSESEELSHALAKADEQVRQGFDAIGVQGDALEEALAFRRFGRLHFNDLRHYLTGGVAKLFADIMADVKSTRKDLEETRGKDLQREAMLREDRSRLVSHALNTYDRVREAAVSAAVIEAKKSEARMAQSNPRKGPAFAPLAVKVEQGGNVTIHAQPDPPQQPPPEPQPVPSPS